MLKFGWIDFSKHDRDMVLSVLNQLSEPLAVDELGIGTIRDGFSDILFPGTSTIQTRAKYLFLVPYLCMELERGKPLSAEQFVTALEAREIELIDLLDVDGAEGVIGQRARGAIMRKPSSIYWRALFTYEFSTSPVRVSIAEYAKHTYLKKLSSEQRKLMGRQSRDYDDPSDDVDVGFTDSVFWRVPTYETNWRDDLSIDLRKDEAECLLRQITSVVPIVRDSLLALILRENRRDFLEFEKLTEIDGLEAIMPKNVQQDYRLARDFACFIFGAQVRYNVIYSRGQNETANELWREYIDERPSVSLTDVFNKIKPHTGVRRFLQSFASVLDNEHELDKLLTAREKQLKGSARAKLLNPDYRNNDINMQPLSYRLRNVQRIVRDVFEGLDRDA